MEIKFNEATPQRKEDHVLDAPLVPINITTFIKQLKQESTWKESDRNSITIYKTNGLRMVLVALHKNAEMPTHDVEGIISLQILEGKIKFITPAHSLELSTGEMLALHQGIPHSVSALKETVFLLTLTTTLEDK